VAGGEGGVAGTPAERAPAAPGRGWGGRGLRHLLVLPTAVLTVVCFVIPLGLIAVYSLGSENLVTFNVFFGWTTANYRGFASSLYVHTLLRSLTLSVATTGACAILGLALAYFISRQPQRM
jgi:ABC-type spermidine/putrescine transport system permease subunit I